MRQLAGLFEIAKAEVLAKVTIPMYFKSIIVPQLDGYYDDYPVDFDVKPVVCCPLHDEETPSFRYYEETSSFFCFGCQTGGNIINLHMKYASRMNGSKVSYREAVFFLYDYFITSNRAETPKVAQIESIEPLKLNSEQDIVRLNLYRVEMEKMISFDKSISAEAKKQLWKMFDQTDLLISLNLIKADDAKRYMQHKIRELTSVK